MNAKKKEHTTFSTALSAEINQLAVRSELPDLSGASDSTVGNYSSNVVMDPSNAELIQRHFREQRGRVGEISCFSFPVDS